MKYVISFLSPILYALIIVIWNFIKNTIWGTCCLDMKVYAQNINQFVLIIDAVLLLVFYIGVLLIVGTLLFKKKWRYAQLFLVGSAFAFFLISITLTIHGHYGLCQGTPELHEEYNIEELFEECLSLK